MLQLNHSQATNTNAVYPDVLAPIGTTQVLLDFTQSINKNTTSNIIATLANTVSAVAPAATCIWAICGDMVVLT